MNPKKIYMIHISDDGREYFDESKGAFLHEEVAKAVCSAMRMFQGWGDDADICVRAIKLSDAVTLERWMDRNAPWRQEA